CFFFFFFQAEDGIRDFHVTGVQTCALPILKTIRLSYSIPGQIYRRIRASNAQISVEAQNLLLLYSDDKLNGQDPEFFSAGGVALPQPRLITTSIILGF